MKNSKVYRIITVQYDENYDACFLSAERYFTIGGNISRMAEECFDCVHWMVIDCEKC
jgi:hypothetical protein